MLNDNPCAELSRNRTATESGPFAARRLRAALVASGLVMAAALSASVLAAGPVGVTVHSRERDELSLSLPVRAGAVERFDPRRVSVSSSGFRAKAGGTAVTVSSIDDPVDPYGGYPVLTPGTLRYAIDYVNSQCGYGPYTIDFTVTTGSVINVAAGYPLGDLTCNGTLVDGLSNGGVILDGSGLARPSLQSGLSIWADDVEVRGLTIQNMPYNGIETLCGGYASKFHSNVLVANGGWGMWIGDGECGGVSQTVIEANVVSGNGAGGILLYGNSFSPGGDGGANSILGNAVTSNGGPGLRLQNEIGTVIGSLTDPGSANEFSGNSGPGVEVFSTGTTVYTGHQFGINVSAGNGPTGPLLIQLKSGRPQGVAKAFGGIGYDVNPNANALSGDGSNGNDAGDALKPYNYPELSSVTFNTATNAMRLQGTLDSGDSGPFTALVFGGAPATSFDAGPYVGQFTLAAAGAFDQSISYDPTLAAKYGGVTMNATGTESSEISGLFALPLVTQSATALNFGSVIVGNSATLPVTLSNVTGFTLLSATSPAAGFSVDGSACAAPTGSTCIVNVTFAPTTASAFSGTIEFLSNSGSLQKVAVTGSGGVLVPGISLAPSALTFASQEVGTTSVAQEIVLTNTGTGPLAISGIATTAGDFGHSSNCPASPSTLAAGAVCKIFVTFSPLIAGDRTGTLTVTSNASTGSGTASLFGIGVSGAVPSVFVSPNPALFPSTLVGSTSEPVTLQVRNTGTAPLVVSSAFVDSSEFQISSNGCGSSVALVKAKIAGPIAVAPGEACVLTVVFAPYSPGTYISTLRIYSNAPASPTLVSLQAVATDATAPEPQPVITLTATPIALDFGSQVIGTISAVRTISISNSGNAAATISAVTATGDFAQSNDCTNVPAGSNCTISVTFAPSATGDRGGSIVVAGNASNAPLTIGLAGLGILPRNPVIELSVTSLSFGNSIVGAGAGARTVTVRNAGGVPLSVSEIGGPFEFPLSSRCASALPPGGTCQFDVGFQPTVPGSRTGQVTVLSNAVNGPAVVGVSGTGCRITLQNRIPALVCR